MIAPNTGKQWLLSFDLSKPDPAAMSDVIDWWGGGVEWRVGGGGVDCLGFKFGRVQIYTNDWAHSEQL